MIRHTALLACLVAMIATMSSASACSIWTEPPLQDETDEAYRIRVTALEQEQAARWARERQVRALEGAELIFIARNREWTPPAPLPKPLPKLRPGQVPPPPVPIPPPIFDPYNSKSYFKPVAWLKGAKVTNLFQIRTSMTSCGLQGFGDVLFPKPGDAFLFFVRKSPITRDTLIDAIALDKVDDPALTEFVAKYRQTE